jgi:hypothetical protein
MRRLVLALMLAIASGVVGAQTRFGLAPDDYALAVQWLRSTCLAPNSAEIIGRLRARAAALQPAFFAALAEGPTQSEVAEVRAGAAEIHRRQRAALDDPQLRGAIPAERIDALRRRTEEEFVRTEVDNFVNGYRSNAMSGIAVVGDAGAIERLREIARGPDRAAAIAAQGALAFRDSLPR